MNTFSSHSVSSCASVLASLHSSLTNAPRSLLNKEVELYRAIEKLNLRIDQPQQLFAFLQSYPLVVDVDISALHWLDASALPRYVDPLRTSCLSIVRYHNQTYCMPWPIKLLVLCQVLLHLQTNVHASQLTLRGEHLLDLVYRCHVSIGPHSMYPYHLPLFAQSTAYQSVHVIAKLWSPILHYFKLRSCAPQRTLKERRALFHDSLFWRGVAHIVHALLFVTIVSETDTKHNAAWSRGRDTVAWTWWATRDAQINPHNEIRESNLRIEWLDECNRQVDSILNENDHAYGPWRDKYIPRIAKSVLNLTDILYAPIHCLRTADILLSTFAIPGHPTTASSPHGDEPFMRMDTWSVRVVSNEEIDYHTYHQSPAAGGASPDSSKSDRHVLLDTRGHQTTALDWGQWIAATGPRTMSAHDVPSCGSLYLTEPRDHSSILYHHAMALAIYLHQQIDGHGIEHREHVIDFFSLFHQMETACGDISRILYAFVYGHPPPQMICPEVDMNITLRTRIDHVFHPTNATTTWVHHHKEQHGGRHWIALCTLLFPYIEVDVSDATYISWSERKIAKPTAIAIATTPRRGGDGVDQQRRTLIRGLVQANMEPSHAFVSVMSSLRFFVPPHMETFINSLQSYDRPLTAHTAPLAPPQRSIPSQICHLIAPAIADIAAQHEWTLDTATYLCGPRTNPYHTILPLPRSLLLSEQYKHEWPSANIPPLIKTFRARWKVELEKEEAQCGALTRKRTRNDDDSPVYRPPPTPPMNGRDDGDEASLRDDEASHRDATPMSPSYSPTSPAYEPNNEQYSPAR